MKFLNIVIYVLGLVIGFNSLSKVTQTTAQQQVQVNQPPEIAQELSQEITSQAGIAPIGIAPTVSNQNSGVEISGATPELEDQIRQDIQALPNALRRSIEIIVVSPKVERSETGVTIAATALNEPGKKSIITIYRNGEPYDIGLLAHEAAHNLAAKTWGTSDPPKEYESYWHDEGGVSEYGGTSPTEDFAEAVRLYTEGKLQSISPRRHAYIAKLLADK